MLVFAGDAFCYAPAELEEVLGGCDAGGVYCAGQGLGEIYVYEEAYAGYVRGRMQGMSCDFVIGLEADWVD